MDEYGNEKSEDGIEESEDYDGFEWMRMGLNRVKIRLGLCG